MKLQTSHKYFNASPQIILNHSRRYRNSGTGEASDDVECQVIERNVVARVKTEEPHGGEPARPRVIFRPAPWPTDDSPRTEASAGKIDSAGSAYQP
jgi:hypothetical protein